MKKKLDSSNEVSEKVVADVVKSKKPDDDPSWYHYVIVLAFFGLIIFGIYYVYDYFETKDLNQNGGNGSTGLVLHKYPYKVGNVTYNLGFRHSVEDLEAMNFTVEPNKLDILNTIKFNFSFLEYDGDDNGEVLKGSSMLANFLQSVYKFNFEHGSFNKYNITNCSTSSMSNKVVVFNPYSDKEGVFFNQSNGCIEFLTHDPKRTSALVDKFIYELVTEE